MKEILSKCPRATKRKLAIYNLEHNTEHKLIDLGIRVVNDESYYYGVKFNDNFKVSDLDFYKTYFDTCVNSLNHLLLISKKTYANDFDVEIIMDNKNKSLITINHEKKTITATYSLLSSLENKYMSLKVIPYVLKEVIFDEPTYEVLYS